MMEGFTSLPLSRECPDVLFELVKLRRQEAQGPFPLLLEFLVDVFDFGPRQAGHGRRAFHGGGLAVRSAY